MTNARGSYSYYHHTVVVHIYCYCVIDHAGVININNKIWCFTAALPPLLSLAHAGRSLLCANETTDPIVVFFPSRLRCPKPRLVFFFSNVLCSVLQTKNISRLGGRRVIVSPFDGLTIGVVTVPLLVSSVFSLAELNRVDPGEEVGWADKGGGGGDVLELGYSEDDAGICEEGVELVEYLEAVLESSVLCAVWEVTGRRRDVSISLLCCVIIATVQQY